MISAYFSLVLLGSEAILEAILGPCLPTVNCSGSHWPIDQIPDPVLQTVQDTNASLP
jgi:hypothetical protein